MKEHEILQIAIENLQRNSGIIANWIKRNDQRVDGKITFRAEGLKLTFHASIKHELRNHQLLQISHLADRNEPLILIVNHIFPEIKEELRKRKIAYLEANGNIYLHHNSIIIWIDTNKPIQSKKGKNNRAFTKTGLQVIFHFLSDERIINKTYREIARKTNVALGNINYIINGLKDLGFLVKLDKNNYKLLKKKDLINKWMDAYFERLKPSLEVGTFCFQSQEDFTNWKMIQLQKGKTWWGGEPAGDLLIGGLRPAELTIYTDEPRNELIKNYRLIPHEKGNVKVYKKFWNFGKETNAFVPLLLVYADLINANNKRSQETAIKIYEQLLQSNLKESLADL